MRYITAGLLVAILGQLSSTMSIAQTTDSQVRSEIERLLVINGTFDSYNRSAEQMFDAFIKSVRVARPDIPDQFYEALRKTLMKEGARMIADTRDEWVGLYAKRFNRAEIATLLEFYDSPLGHKISAFNPELEREGAQIATRWEAKNMPRIRAELEKQLRAMP